MSLEKRTELTTARSKPRLRDHLLNKVALRFLPDAKSGQLRVSLPSGDTIICGTSGKDPAVQVEIKRWRALWKLAFQGDNGFAKAYEDSDIVTADLLPLFEFALRNRSVADHSITPSKMGLLVSRLQHAWRHNSRAGSKRNIMAHYDLGNEFYRPWLDESMSYSSAIYSSTGMPLEAAQMAKIKRIADLLETQPGNTVLEIGCGWGALMQELIQNHGCSATGITLSHEQAAYARKRLADDAAKGKADVVLRDYRDCNGPFDRIVSIEMIEAVGEAYWPAYFSTMRRCLARGGLAVVQAITIAEERFAAYQREPDFIQQRIFPGGMLPTIELMKKHAEAAGLKITYQELFGESYAQTLAEWRRRFHASWPKIQALGFDPRFKRLWDYYLAYCEAGFRHGATNVGLYVLRPA